jgi:CHAT domain-containing protein
LGNLEKAAEFYRLTIESIEKVRVESLTEDRKIGYWQSKQATFERAVALLHRLQQQDSEADYTAQAFAYAERARARALLDLLAEAKVKPSRGVSPQFQHEERTIFQETSRIQKKLLRDDVSRAERSKLERELTRAEERLEEFKQRVRLSHPAYAALQYPQPFTLEKVQREVLNPDTLLLEFMLGEKQSFLWAVSKAESRMVALLGREAIEQRVKRYRQALTSPPAVAEAVNVDQSQGNRLYRTLLGPVEKMLGKYNHVIIVPDGILHYLPFETLVTRREAGRPRFLISDHSISYASSASALGLLHSERAEASEREPRLLAYADPLFKTSNKGTKRTKGVIQLVDVTRGRYDQLGMRFDPLPYARVEVKSIAGQFPKTAAQLYLGREATESSLKRERLERFSQIHFATHGLIDEQVPARSGVVLSLVGERQEDGVLQMNEIFDLDLNAELVVLSACQSGLGKVIRGEGMVGLTRAFMYAGADSIVVSLWNVRDSSTAGFMKGFYRHLREGKPKAEALRHAKLEMLRSERQAHRHPYYWAAFVLAGRSHEPRLQTEAHHRSSR